MIQEDLSKWLVNQDPTQEVHGTLLMAIQLIKLAANALIPVIQVSGQVGQYLRMTHQASSHPLSSPRVLLAAQRALTGILLALMNYLIKYLASLEAVGIIHGGIHQILTHPHPHLLLPLYTRDIHPLLIWTVMLLHMKRPVAVVATVQKQLGMVTVFGQGYLIETVLLGFEKAIQGHLSAPTQVSIVEI